MPFPRRKRLLALLVVLAVLTVIYLTTGAQQTRSSPFYQKTMALMERKRVEAAEKPLTGRGAGRRTGDGGEVAQEGDYADHRGDFHMDTAKQDMDRLRGSLKEAEVRAKELADTKWKDAKDAGEQLVDVQGEPQQQQAQNVKAVAGRKKVPIAPAGSDQEALLSSSSEQAPHDPTTAELELARLLTLSPVLIFSKSYCPYSRKAKHILLDNYNITPLPHVVELDLLEDGMGSRLQELLKQRTGRGTVPNVLVGGDSIGGGDDMEEMWKGGRLAEVVEKAAGREVRSVVEVVKYVPTEDEG